jgi:hypothetical protein
MQTISRLPFSSLTAIPPRPWVEIRGRRFPSFLVCGYIGFAIAVGQSILLGKHMGLSQLTLLGIAATVVATFYSLVMAVKILYGEEILIYYRLEIALIAVVAIFLRLTGHPVLPYLDVVVLAIGTFLVCGRIGCLMVGCCHGRPCRRGVTYGEEHVRIGFPSHLVGVGLFPIQAVESLIVLCVVAWGTMAIIGGALPGTASTLYTLIYGAARFFLEFARGDRERPYLWGFSEAQWTSLLLAIAVVGAEWARELPFSNWHWTIAALLGATMVFLAAWRRLDPAEKDRLFHPHHVWEIASALNHLVLSGGGAKPPSQPPELIHVVQTSLGYRLSIDQPREYHNSIQHCSVSKEDGSLSLAAVRPLARLIAQLASKSGRYTVVPGRRGVFHILFDGPGGIFEN